MPVLDLSVFVLMCLSLKFCVFHDICTTEIQRLDFYLRIETNSIISSQHAVYTPLPSYKIDLAQGSHYFKSL